MFLYLQTGPGGLPVDLVPTILSFLGPEDRARCSFVSTKWRSICHQLEEDEIALWISELVTKRDNRNRQRQKNRLLLQRQAEEAGNHFGDPYWELSLARNYALKTSDCGSNYSHVQITRIIELLDQGAELLHNPNEDWDRSILHVLVPLHFKEPHWPHYYDDAEVEKDLKVLTEFVASPCTSWRDESCVPWSSMISQYVLVGSWQTFRMRWEAWKMFRAMVHMAQHFESEVGDMSAFWKDLSDPPNYVNNRDFPRGEIQLSWTDFYFIHLFHDFMLPLAPRPLLYKILIETLPIRLLALKWYRSLPEVVNPSDVNRSLQWFWASKERQRQLYQHFTRSHSFRLLIIDSHLEPFCKRNDFKALELLVTLEPEALAAKIPYILTNLRLARGENQRLISYFMAMETTRRQKDALLQDVIVFTCRR